MRARTIILATVAAVGAVAVIGSASASGPNAPPEDAGMSERKSRLWNRLLAIPNLTPTQRGFLMVTAYGEGGYSSHAHNGSATERAAAERGISPELANRAAVCGIPRTHLASGSWGTFQRLAPFWASDMFAIFGAGACPLVDPTIAAPGNLDLQIADAIHLAHRLQGYGAWQAAPTVGNLRLGWANPSFMGYLTKHADRIAKYRRHAVAVGYGADFIDATIEPFPSDAAALYFRLRGTS